MLLAALLLGFPGVAAAQEAFAGVYVHGVDTPFSLYTGEGGADLVAGVRSEPIRALSPVGSPAVYAVGSINTAGDTSFIGAGLSWRFGGGPIYVRPGLGLVVHDGPGLRFDPARNERTDLGSRVLFEPELAVGYQVNDTLSVEASWMHVSHARLFDSQQNPGIDMMGVRVNSRLR